LHPDELLVVPGVELERTNHLWGWVSMDVTNRSGEMLKWKDIYEKFGCVSDVLVLAWFLAYSWCGGSTEGCFSF